MALREDTWFNRLVNIEFMFLEQEAVLHAVNGNTLFCAATILNGQSAAEVSTSFRALPSSSGIKMRSSGGASHNALGAGQRYRAYLRLFFLRVREDHRGVAVQLALSMTV